MKIELTIKVDYLPSWGAHEGVRELLQNAKDAETEFDAVMSVRMRDNTLVIENEGCTMPYQALLLGHSTKTERGDLIGKFGEGFKLGILALLREGHSVKIRNGSEVWIPEITYSEKFEARVLAFEISTGRKNENRVQIEISGIDPDYYRDQIKPRFLWLDKDGRRKEDIVKTSQGTLLLGDHYRGKVFVKGILVQTKSSLSVGYDLNDADVDRDRRMVSSYDFSYRTRAIWSEAITKRPDLESSFLEIIEENGSEAQCLDAYAAKSLPEAFVKHVADDFIKKHGANAIPVSNLGESKDLEHYGRRGVIVNAPLRAVLERTMGELSKVQESLKTEEKRSYSWSELSSLQQENIKRAIALVDLVSPISTKDISIVDFRSDNLQGLYSNGDIKLSVRVTQNKAQCLAILVHEVAHRKGVDGSHDHVCEIERIWSAIVESMDEGRDNKS